MKLWLGRFCYSRRTLFNFPTLESLYLTVLSRTIFYAGTEPVNVNVNMNAKQQTKTLNSTTRPSSPNPSNKRPPSPSYNSKRLPTPPSKPPSPSPSSAKPDSTQLSPWEPPHGRKRSTPRSRCYLHICLILSRKDGSVLSDGFNSEVSIRSANPRDGFSVHAEEVALGRLGRCERKKLRCGVDVVSLRVSRAMVVGMSRPCLRCAGKLTSSLTPVRRVYWWESSSEVGAEGWLVQSRAEELPGQTEHSTGDHFVKKGVSKHPWGVGGEVVGGRRGRRQRGKL